MINALIILVVTSSMTYCSERDNRIKPQHIKKNERVRDSLAPTFAEQKKKDSFEVTYRIDSLDTKTAVDSFRNRYTRGQRKLIAALNRVDAYRVGVGDHLVVPDTLTGNLMDYSPFPKQLDLLDSIPKAVLISQRIQAVALYEKDSLVLWGPVSSGKKATPTPNGLHYGNYKARNKVSTVNSNWLMPYYFNFMNFAGVGTHQYSLPGYPASHACVRLRKQEASFLYNWAEQWKLSDNEQIIERNGTPFMVFGTYAYDQVLPWMRLAEKRESNALTLAEKDTLRSYVRMYFKDARNFAQPRSPEGPFSSTAVQGIETVE